MRIAVLGQRREHLEGFIYAKYIQSMVHRCFDIFFHFFLGTLRAEDSLKIVYNADVAPLKFEDESKRANFFQICTNFVKVGQLKSPQSNTQPSGIFPRIR